MARRIEKNLSAILFQLSGLRVFVSLRAVGRASRPPAPAGHATRVRPAHSSNTPLTRRRALRAVGAGLAPALLSSYVTVSTIEDSGSQRRVCWSRPRGIFERGGRGQAPPLRHEGTIAGGCITIGESVGRDDAAPSRGAGGGADPPPLPYGTRGTIAGGCITIGESVGRDHGIFERGGRGRTPRLRHRRDAARIAAHSLHSDFLLDLSPLRPETLSVSPEP